MEIKFVDVQTDFDPDLRVLNCAFPRFRIDHSTVSRNVRTNLREKVTRKENQQQAYSHVSIIFKFVL